METSFHAEKFSPPLKGFLQNGGGLRRMQKRFGDLTLVLDGQPDNLSLFDGPASSFTRRRHDRIGQRAPFDLRSALQQCMNIVRKTSFESGYCLCLFCHNGIVVRQNAVYVNRPLKGYQMGSIGFVCPN